MNVIRGKGGFTLIELMVSVSVIAIISAMAVANLLRSRMAANETAAIASLRTLSAAQQIFKRSDYDGDGTREYAWYWELSRVWQRGSDGRWRLVDLQLIDRGLANAHLSNSPYLPYGSNPIPKSGYLFHEAYGVIDQNNRYHPFYLYVNGRFVFRRYGFIAMPAAYDGTGRNLFAIDDHGVVWQIDAALEPYYTRYKSLKYLYEASAMRARGWANVE